jgi:hypothetical protein
MGRALGSAVAARTQLASRMNEQAQLNANANRDLAAQKADQDRDLAAHKANLDAVVAVRGQDSTAATANARLGYEAGKDNRASIEKQIERHAESRVPAETPGTLYGTNKKDPKAREAEVKTYAADLMDRIEESVARRGDGKRVEQLSPAELRQLTLADNIRRKVEDKRSELGQSARDFFGTKRFDSRNLYGYLPTKAEPANDGGFVVHFGNGNTAKADIVGGDFKWLSPNAPVDADIQELVAPLIRKARQGSK